MSDLKTLLSVTDGKLSLSASQINALITAGLDVATFNDDQSPHRIANLSNLFTNAKQNGFSDEKVVAHVLVYMLKNSLSIIGMSNIPIIVGKNKLQNMTTLMSVTPAPFLPAIMTFWYWWVLLSKTN
jgi:hypothetical protein